MSQPSALGTGWEPFTLELYNAAASACEIVVRLNARDYSTVRGLLVYDLKEHGMRGMCLSARIPHLGLEKDDRLEPCELLPCTAAFDDLRPEGDATVMVQFWRRSRETRVRRRNPVFKVEPHLTPDRPISADNLHLLSLRPPCLASPVLLYQSELPPRVSVASQCLGRHVASISPASRPLWRRGYGFHPHLRHRVPVHCGPEGRWTHQ